MTAVNGELRPDLLLENYLDLFTLEALKGPILDLACGDGHNGIFLASRGLPVILADRSEEALRRAKESAEVLGVLVQLWQVDLESEDMNPLQTDSFGAILVFRYLHRPLIPCIRKALRRGGILIYETFTIFQRELGKPRNPDHLLNPNELLGWFRDWHILHYFEGIEKEPGKRAIARIVCRRP
jgi:tellurite methyltransferase